MALADDRVAWERAPDQLPDVQRTAVQKWASGIAALLVCAGLLLGITFLITGIRFFLLTAP